MDDFVLTAVLFKAAYAAACIALVYWVMRAVLSYSATLDRRAGLAFTESMKIMKADPLALAVYKGLRILGLLIMAAAMMIMLGLLMGCSPASAGPLFPDRYDGRIKAAAERYLPAYDWHWAKAQLFQESRLDPAAVSPVGAAGLGQFMPETWRQVARELHLPAGISPHHETAIEAYAYYMAKPCLATWRADTRTPLDRLRLAQGSYNAGVGSLIRAQVLCGDPPGYHAIARCLPQVTGRHAQETLAYVNRIARWRAMMRAGG